MVGTRVDTHTKEEMAGHASVEARVRGDRIVTALATGVLLGALAAMPYDQLLGISGSASIILRSVLTTAVWAGLRSEQSRDLNFSAISQATRAFDQSTSGRGTMGIPVREVGESWKWNLDRIQNVLKVRAESIMAHYGG